MKALVYTKYGPPNVLQLKDIEKPHQAANELLVKVCASTVNRTDNATIKAKPFFARVVTGLLKPKKQTPGTEFSGIVEAVGEGITKFRDGDRVFGFDDQGAESHAEYLVISEDKLANIPENISYQQAAASSEGAHYAYNFINKVPLESGQKVLVNGATGAIGSAAVQLLNYFGVTVTAVCGTANIEQVRALGASKVIDYQKQDFTKDNELYDYVFDTVGKSSFFKCKHLLKRGGVYISSDLGFMSQNIFLPMITPLIKPLFENKKTAAPFPLNINKTLTLVKQLMEDGKFTALIDREYPFEQIIDAYKYVEKGHKKGNVVINIT